jgi:hypothetical protein
VPHIHFFDEASGGLLQSVTYHTSCSQPITLGDVVGNATLVAYDGELGAGQMPPAGDSGGSGLPDASGILLVPSIVDDPFDAGNIGDDADSPTGPLAQRGDKLTRPA